MFVLTGGFAIAAIVSPGGSLIRGSVAAAAFVSSGAQTPKKSGVCVECKHTVKKGRLSAASKPDPPAPGRGRRAAEAIPKGYPHPRLESQL